MARLRCKCGYTMILKHGADEGEHRFMKTDTWMELSRSLARSILEVQLDGPGRSIGAMIEAMKTDPDASLEEAIDDSVRESVREEIRLALEYGFAGHRTFYECPECKRLTVFWDAGSNEGTSYRREDG